MESDQFIIQVDSLQKQKQVKKLIDLLCSAITTNSKIQKQYPQQVLCETFKIIRKNLPKCQIDVCLKTFYQLVQPILEISDSDSDSTISLDQDLIVQPYDPTNIQIQSKKTKVFNKINQKTHQKSFKINQQNNFQMQNSFQYNKQAIQYSFEQFQSVQQNKDNNENVQFTKVKQQEIKIQKDQSNAREQPGRISYEIFKINEPPPQDIPPHLLKILQQVIINANKQNADLIETQLLSLIFCQYGIDFDLSRKWTYHFMKKYGRQRITSNKYQLILRKLLVTTLRYIQNQVTNIKRKKTKRTNVHQTNQLKKTLSHYQVWLPPGHLLTFRYLLKFCNEIDSKYIIEKKPTQQQIVQLYIYIMQPLSKSEGVKNNLSLHEETTLGNSYEQLKIPPLVHHDEPDLQKKKDRLKLMGWKNSWTSEYQNQYLKIFLSGKTVQDARRYFILLHKQFQQILNRYRIRDVLANVFQSAFRILVNRANYYKELFVDKQQYFSLQINLTVIQLRVMVNDPNFKQFRLKLVKFYLFKQTDEKQVQELVYQTKRFLQSLSRKKKRRLQQNKNNNRCEFQISVKQMN